MVLFCAMPGSTADTCSPSCGHTHDVKDRVKNNNNNNNSSSNNNNNTPPGADHRVVVEGLSSQSVRPL